MGLSISFCRILASNSGPFLEKGKKEKHRYCSSFKCLDQNTAHSSPILATTHHSNGPLPWHSRAPPQDSWRQLPAPRLLQPAQASAIPGPQTSIIPAAPPPVSSSPKPSHCCPFNKMYSPQRKGTLKGTGIPRCLVVRTPHVLTALQKLWEGPGRGAAWALLGVGASGGGRHVSLLQIKVIWLC